ncbi:hypothetical protein RRG08_047722 [Elysia crispata]|uniref:Uncharacterized protein n=1 Tax=Elysia crispata TaxID=231223 RepID=A0AAE1AAS8_9GAST|nr:hypothetical protein RRG08_047722 [Elysia crispata]
MGGRDCLKDIPDCFQGLTDVRPPRSHQYTCAISWHQHLVSLDSSLTLES